jgi:DNA-binding XRE family transcriptional regulator
MRPVSAARARKKMQRTWCVRRVQPFTRTVGRLLDLHSLFRAQDGLSNRCGFGRYHGPHIFVSRTSLPAQRVAEKVGVSRNSINAVENGKFDPPLPLAFRIVEVFGLKIEDVFQWEG